MKQIEKKDYSMNSKINTLKDLKNSGYVPLDIKDEMIKNLSLIHI